MEAEEDQVNWDMRTSVATHQASGVPDHLSRLMMAYGPIKCDIYGLSCIPESQRAIRTYAESRERDLYALGLKQAALITKTEHAIVDRVFETQDQWTEEFVTDDIRTPFMSWRDSVHHTTKAARDKGNADEEDPADILEIKYIIGKHALPKAMDLARTGLQRNLCNRTSTHFH